MSKVVMFDRNKAQNKAAWSFSDGYLTGIEESIRAVVEIQNALPPEPSERPDAMTVLNKLFSRLELIRVRGMEILRG